MIEDGQSVISDATVALAWSQTAVYPDLADAPFHPHEAYPEYRYKTVSANPNPAYALVRECLMMMGLDRDRAGTAAWNPLGDLIRPGDKVVLKPNWVLHLNQAGLGMACMTTHPSILRAMLDYTLLARPGSVIVGDAPLQLCDFEALLDYGYRDVIAFHAHRDAPVQTRDFRRTILVEDPRDHALSENLRPMDEFVLVDVGRDSLLEDITGTGTPFRVTMYDPRKMKDNHAPGRHRYLVAREILDADVVINLPKLKMHKKAGITCALKNLIGINGNKDYLPHHRKGPTALGGDNYPESSPLKWTAEQVLEVAYRNMGRKHLYHTLHFIAEKLLILNMKLGGNGDVEGGWYGNDTIWRTCLDLNRILLHSDPEGTLHEHPQRRVLSLADAIVIGDGDGPLKPGPYPMGCILGAANPAALDWVAAILMGLDPEEVPICRHAIENRAYPILTDRNIRCTTREGILDLPALAERFTFSPEPPPGWKGHCEWETDP
ncbi:MAG: DUF362 domain-containing protein [Kiritimatiellae bacterium]|nr:DUF362 domain-containing protein [Kiritimatiellia bacterium]